MGLFDLERKGLKKVEKPDWVFSSNSTVLRIYDLVIERASEIESQLQDGKVLVGKARKITNAALASQVGKNSAYLNKRDYPELCQFIASTNEHLERLGARINPKTKSVNNSSHLHSMNKDALKIECTSLRKKVDHLESLLLQDQLQRLSDSGYLEKQHSASEKINRLMLEIQELTTQVISANQRENKVMEELKYLLQENLNLKKSIKALGVQVKPSIKSVK